MIIKDLNELKEITNNLKSQCKRIVWTNGCFDIMHPGHIYTFEEAKKLWDILIVWLNGDKSPYWATKPGRPIHDEWFRAKMLDSLKYIDYVFIFDEETPIIPIETIIPDILVKWWDYKKEEICWYDIVVDNGWEVITIPIVGEYSTSNSIKKIINTYGT